MFSEAKKIGLGFALVLFAPGPVPLADEVLIEFVRLERQSSGAWRASVTLRHADSGWDHYADGWRVVAGDGMLLGERTLYHPHVDEQPFTRSLADIEIAPGQAVIYVEAHDKVHGWAEKRVLVDLERPAGPAYEVLR